MMTKSMSNFLEMSQESSRPSRLSIWQQIRPAWWQVVALVSFGAGIGNGWRALTNPTAQAPPLLAAVTMMLVTFAGWYVWGFFTYLTDAVLFGGHADYRETLDAFGRAFVFQGLLFFTFINSFGWLWGWVALYVTVAAWGIIGPRRLGMRTWQAVVAASLGMLVWLACLLILTLTFVWDGAYIGVGVFTL